MSAVPSGTVPVLILKEGTSRTTGREAQRNNIMAAKIIAETVKTTLGPKGMDKMLVSSFGDVSITNDGATILKELDVQQRKCLWKLQRPRTTRLAMEQQLLLF
jgi:chaperonin GroEL (HSP60 family)